MDLSAADHWINRAIGQVAVSNRVMAAGSMAFEGGNEISIIEIKSENHALPEAHGFIAGKSDIDRHIVEKIGLEYLNCPIDGVGYADNIGVR
jgi:hypothetical protein